MMPDWSDRFWPAGTQVQIVECLDNGDTQYLGVGELVYDFHPFSEEDEDLNKLFENAPTIKTPDARMIRGYDCWWVPVEIANNG